MMEGRWWPYCITRLVCRLIGHTPVDVGGAGINVCTRCEEFI